MSFVRVNDTDSKPSIPKFTSFRSKATPDGQVGEVRDRPVAKKKHRERQRERHRHGSHSPHSNDRSRRENQPSDYVHRQSGPKREDPLYDRREVCEYYVIDRIGDSKNVAYGSVHRWSVPAFHRYGAGGVLGISSDIKIDRKCSEETGLVLSNWRMFRSHKREKYAFSKVERERPRLLKLRSEAARNDPSIREGDFISLTRSNRKGHSDQGGDELDNIASDDGNNYRSIHGKAKSGIMPADSDFEYAQESDSLGSDTGWFLRLDDSVRERNVELSRRVEQFPHDIEAWVSLIDHQDRIIEAGDDRRRITNAEISSTAEIKIHMFENALQNTQTLKDREGLLLGLMAEGSKVWELKEQSARWERISEDNIESSVLWKAYLDFRQTLFPTFRFEEVRDIHLQRLKVLWKAVSSAPVAKSDVVYLQIIYVILRLTVYMRESGFSELAIAAWQVLLEMNFLAPKQLPANDYRTHFQEYWDSEVPRIGEAGSLGWSTFIENEGSSIVPEAQIDEMETALSLTYDLQSWSVAERARQRASRLPARTMDDVVEDDPYRVILSSDIEPFLLLLPSDPICRKALIDAFLIFCGQPPTAQLSGSGQANAWNEDDFLNGNITGRDIEYIKTHILGSSVATQNEVETPDVSSITSTPVANFVGSYSTYFNTNWFHSLKPWNEVHAGDNGPVPYIWFRTTLRQIVEVYPDDELVEYYLAFEWQNEPTTIKKVAKTFLKQHSSSLRSYNAYAMIESAKGNKEVAGRVFSATLQMGRSKKQNEGQDRGLEQSMDSILSWTNWIWACLEDGDRQRALQNLLSIPDGSPSTTHDLSTTTLLKTEQHLSSNRDYLLSSGNLFHAILYTECLALLHYLTSISDTEPQSQSQGNISAALKVSTAFTSTLSSQSLSHSPFHALLLQSSTRLLFQHIKSGPYRPTLLRSHLTHCLTLFPNNTIFLTFYTWNESRFTLFNLVHNPLTSSHSSSTDTLTTHIFTIHLSLRTGTPHAIHSSFEHAVSSLSCRGAAGLWNLYALWCVSTKEYRSKAKEVWLRGVKACPWCKELFMTGFEVGLEMGIGMEEGRGVWRVMGEKELRVSIDLEGWLEEREGS